MRSPEYLSPARVQHKTRAVAIAAACSACGSRGEQAVHARTPMLFDLPRKAHLAISSAHVSRLKVQIARLCGWLAGVAGGRCAPCYM